MRARLINASGFDLPQYQSAQAVGNRDPANARAMGQIIGGYQNLRPEFRLLLQWADVNTNPGQYRDREPSIFVGSGRQWRHRWWPLLYKGFTMRAGLLGTLKHFPGYLRYRRGQPPRVRPAAPRLGQRCGRRS